MKICFSCKIERDDSVLGPKRYVCLPCRRQKYKETNGLAHKIYAENNKEKISNRFKIFYQNNKIYFKKYREDNKERHKAYMKKYREEHKFEINEQKKIHENEKWHTDVLYKLRKMVSNSIYSLLQNKGSSKKNRSCMQYINYSIQELKDHLESKFEPWMNWDNHGKYLSENWKDDDVSTWTWNIDHIVPQSKFIFSSMEDEGFKKAWSLNNLRPYSAKLNVIEKNNR